MEQKNKDSFLTLVVKVIDKEDAKWMWDCHLNREVKHGLRVYGLANGDMLAEVERLEDEIFDLREK